MTFMHIQNRNMNYYQNANYANDDDLDTLDFNRESMLGQIPNPDVTNSVNNEVNLELDQEVNEWLKEFVDEELAPDNAEEALKDDDPVNDSLDPRKEQFQDYYDDFPEQKQEPIPQWYEEVLQNKIRETKKRLKNLSDYVCYASAATRQQILRIERDHNTEFCKLDFPKHPPLSAPWQNYWRFNCVTKCKEDPDPPPYHAHTADCELLLLEHVPTGVTTRSKNILPCEFPKHVMDTVELFQIFAKDSSKVNLNNDEVPDTVFEKPNWQYIKIRSNFKGEIMLIACGKGISPALNDLKKFFHCGPGRACNVVSLYCINIKWSQKKSIFPPTFLTGCLELRDKVGPITIYYNPKTNINFNSVEATELGKLMLEYLEPTLETTVIDVGCNIGALSLMLAQKSDKVIGLSTLEHEIKSAEQTMKHNSLHNVTFMTCSPREVKTKISSWVKRCISVATVNLNSPFGKVKECCEVMTALRELPTVWRIAVYGSFSFDNRKAIEKLTSAADDSEFLPMRGCILDKSPSIPNLFDIVILFERKSLIEPKVELIASGPTVNVKSDSFVPLSIKEEKLSGTKPFLKCGRPSKKFGRFDSPMLPIEKDIKPKLPPPPKEILDFTVPPPPPPVSANIKEDICPYLTKEKSHRPSVIDMLNVKELKRKFDSPSLPINPPKTTNASLRNQEVKVNGSEQSTNLPNRNVDKMHDPPTLPSITTESLDCPPWHKPTEIQACYPQQVVQEENSTGSGVLRIKKEQELKFSSQFEFLNKPTNPLTQCPSNQLLQNVAVKSEPQFDFSTLPIKQEQSKISEFTEQKPHIVNRSSPIEREEGELSDSGDNEICFDAIIKPEPMDLDDDDESDFSSVIDSQVKEEIVEKSAVPPLLCVKNVSIDFNEFTIQPIKSEPSDISEDLESIKSTDSNRLSIKPDPESINLSKLQPNPEVDKQFFWHPNFSGLRVKPELGSENFSMNIKSEPIEDNNHTLEQVTENTSSAGVTVKSEILSSLPEIDDIQNMETPIHNPAVLNRQYSPSPPPSASTFDGFEFSVKPNMSFLTLSKQPIKQLVNVKKETVEPDGNQNIRNQDDDEIKIIRIKGEIKDDKLRNDINLEPRTSTKSENSPNETIDDLQVLLEQRQKLQKQLESNVDSEKSKRRFKRSPSSNRGSSPLRGRRSSYSPRDWRSKSRYSPDTVRRRRDRSPESSKWARGTRSPSLDRYRGKRYRSPISPSRRPYKRNYSPDSPDRFYKKRYQSSDLQDSPVYKRRNQSPDIYDRLYGRKNRSPESPGRPWSRRNRSPESPGRPWSRRNRSPESPDRPRSRKNRSSESPDRPRYRMNRSPGSPDKPWLKKNKTPPSFEKNWRFRNKSPPFFQKTWDKKCRSRSPSRINSRSKSRSPSPTERGRALSPADSSSLSPPVKYFKANKPLVDERSRKSPSPSLSVASKTSHDKKGSDSKKKKKKKKKKKSKSKSPNRSESEKKEKKKSKSSSSKSSEKLDNRQLEVVSSEDSPKNLEKQVAVELPNEIPLPTTVV